MENEQRLVRGTSAYRRERRFQRLAHEADVLLALAVISPRDVYCGLLGYARHRQWRDGWAAHAFKEIFGIWPRPEDKGPPLPPPVELEEWINTARKKRKA